MSININLCVEFLGMDNDFWHDADTVLTYLEKNDLTKKIIDNAKEILCNNKDVDETNKLLNYLLNYLRIFSPENADMAIAAFLGSCLTNSLKNLLLSEIPKEYIKDTFKDFSRWANVFYKLNGRRGINEIPWILYHFAGRMLKIGRLMYENYNFNYPYYIFENKITKKLTILAADNINITESGHIENTNGKKELKKFTTKLTLENGNVKGFAVDTEKAVVTSELLTLNLNEENLLLFPGMQILNLHIPAGENFKPENVDRSLKEAKVLFKRLGFPCKIAMCLSWLLDPDLIKFSPENGNIVSFMKRFSKFPVCCSAPAAGKFVFNYDLVWPHYENVKPKTKLQKSLLNYLQNGGEIFDTGGIIVLKD